MKNYTFLVVMLLAAGFGCKKDNAGSSTQTSVKTETIQGNITQNTVLNANTHYILKGQVYVKNNATLTIPAGTTVYAEKNDAADAKTVLIITRGAKIFINGTADKPVVFTSNASVKAQGDWGALVILGSAPTNVSQGNAMGLPISADTQYGGTNTSDNSGSISYLRIEYSGGINPPAEDEWIVDKVSGLSLNGVGSATSIDNVMVTHSNDDGFQFVGGTVNATHLIGYNNGDDDFDIDLGYTGKLQFLISYRTVASSQALRANGIESYTDEVPTTNPPISRPVISNVTIIGPQGGETVKTNLNQAVYIRKGTEFALRNSIIAEYPEGGLMVCMRTRPILLAGVYSEFKNNLVNTDTTARAFCWDVVTAIIPDPALTTFATNSVNKNTVVAASSDLKLNAMYSSGAPDLTPGSGSPALSGSDFTGPDFSSSFFTNTTYRGAIGTTNWAAASNWAVWK
jgi:hypothetical protein